MWTPAVCAFIFFFNIQVSLGKLNNEAKLIDDLLSEYSRIVRPVGEFSEQVSVKHGLALSELESLDEVSGDLTLSVIERFMWTDANLSWDPSEYGGVDHVTLPAELIWKPDIVLYNNLEVDVQRSKDAMAVVISDGTVLWIPMAKTRTRCALDGDTFYCGLKFGSWAYDGNKLDLELYEEKPEVDLSLYLQHRKFNIVENLAERHVIYYPCCEEPYIDIIYQLAFKSG